MIAFFDIPLATPYDRWCFRNVMQPLYLIPQVLRIGGQFHAVSLSEDGSELMLVETGSLDSKTLARNLVVTGKIGDCWVNNARRASWNEWQLSVENYGGEPLGSLVVSQDKWAMLILQSQYIPTLWASRLSVYPSCVVPTVDHLPDRPTSWTPWWGNPARL